MIDYIARLTKSELWNIALYRKQFRQQEREYKIDLQKIDALQHTLKELKEGEEEGDNNRELNVE